jgi:hypothetical protein|tara:strand:+ start:2763 stop:3467 length:705 start_codon:yes stop_codon:yes gene_type:complete
MKYNIIIPAVFIVLGLAMFKVVNITADNISENKTGLNRLNKSFLSLSEEFEDINKNSELVEKVTMSYRNSLINLSDRVDKLEITTYDIHSILKDLDERINKQPAPPVVIEKYLGDYMEPEPTKEDEESLGVNAGLGVLTGTHVTGQPEIVPESIVCPKVISPRPYGYYIDNITIKRTLKFTVIYDLFQGNVTDVRYDGFIPNKVKQATFNYVMDLEFDNPVTITGCTLPFTINI